MWSGIGFDATTRVGFWTWIWHTRHGRLRQEVACWFQCCKNPIIFFDWSTNFYVIDVKMDWSDLDGKSSLKMLGLLKDVEHFFSKLDWGSCILSIAKIATKKIGALIISMKFLSPEVAPYLYKSIIQPCITHCCHVRAVAPRCYLNILYKL